MGALVGASRAVIVGLTVVNLRRAYILALGVVGIGNAAGTGLLIPSIVSVCIINSLSHHIGSNKK